MSTHHWPLGVMDKASASGAGDSRSESLAGQVWQPAYSINWPFEWLGWAPKSAAASAFLAVKHQGHTMRGVAWVAAVGGGG